MSLASRQVPVVHRRVMNSELSRRKSMNSDRIQGNWKQLKGKILEKWGKLTDDHLDVVNGRREVLAGKIQEAYGITKSEAEQQIKDWEKSTQRVDSSDEDADTAHTRPAAPNTHLNTHR
jgi:uncharacterized protein YjbJ (UPF0337 family)